MLHNLTKGVSLAGLGRMSGRSAARATVAMTQCDQERSAGDFVTREQYVAVQIERAGQDERFLGCVAAGDTDRDAGHWAPAERHYREALKLYPYHPGYRVQFAHMLKEQHRFVEAELHYRTALALGAPRDDVAPHLAFSSERNGRRLEKLPALNLAVSALAAPPTEPDVETLAFVFFPDGAGISTEHSLHLLRQCPTNRAVVLAMIADERFQRANLPLLEILKG